MIEMLPASFKTYENGKITPGFHAWWQEYSQRVEAAMQAYERRRNGA